MATVPLLRAGNRAQIAGQPFLPVVRVVGVGQPVTRKTLETNLAPEFRG